MHVVFMITNAFFSLSNLVVYLTNMSEFLQSETPSPFPNMNIHHVLSVRHGTRLVPLPHF